MWDVALRHFFDFDAEQVVSEPFQELARKVLVYR